MNKEYLKQYLLSVLENPILQSGGKEIVCRCHNPGCTDTKRHLYIGPFNGDDSTIIKYNCFKCSASGVVNRNFLYEYGISDIDKDALEANKSSGNIRSYRMASNGVYRISNTRITDCDMTKNKLRYINDRLGLALTYQDCINNKIVLNIGDLLESNNITNYTRHINIMKQLNDNFIGFLSRSNGSLNMRNLNEGNVYKTIDQKYINYKLFNDDIENDFYIIPTKININQHVKLHIAEGPFDILSIFYNVARDKTNSLFIAGKGKAYETVLVWLLTNYYIFDLEVHYYPDRDITDRFIENIIYKFKPFKIQFYMHRNMYPNEKDFGVPVNRIKDRKMKL